MIINFIEIPFPFNFDEMCNFIRNALTDVMDGWMDRWIDAWMDGYLDGQLYSWTIG